MGERRKSATGERRGGAASGRIKSALFVLIGVAFGLFLSGFDSSGAAARSQNGEPSRFADVGNDFYSESDAPFSASERSNGGGGDSASVSLRESLEADATPRVSFVGNASATFSRPLEVPPLYAFDAPLDGGGRQIILVDSETKRICVYWIRERGANSTIELVAARSFESDVKLDNFNGEGLTPAQIREQANALGER